ncbi:16398_t:CDS:2 [Funneliformis mosseae]|uniref:16398_t:CDS:1 n=1 Tax=Funneliformis mosseae TaxID=27381 RepID=A0A9N8W976_FUNMO|nr:16398_t:CDS:2 [Funneliformis mosseae]
MIIPIISQNVSRKTSSTCYVKINNPRPGDRFSPGDEINVKWDLIGLECRNSTDDLVSLYQINAILFANLTRKDEWKWDYHLNLYQETNTNITSFTYPIQMILSPNIRHSSLFFLDIELTFTKNPPGLIFDVMGPFTILPIPETQLSNETDNGQNAQEVFSNFKGNLSMASKSIRIGWIFNVIFVIFTLMNV